MFVLRNSVFCVSLTCIMRYNFALHVPYICLASDNSVENNFEECRCWNYEINKK